MRSLLLTLALTFATGVSAQEYSVDSAGGPLTLHEDVERAFQLWEREGATVPVEADSATSRFAFGPVDRLGPDTVTLTLQRTGAEPALEILVQPDLYRDFEAALVHEAGIVLGIGQQESGVMRPGLDSESVAAPQPGDIARLRSVATAAPGDLNADGKVDFLDLVELASQSGRRGVNLPGDLDGDGVLGNADLVLLRELYTFTLPHDPADAPAETTAEPEQSPGSEEPGESEEQETVEQPAPEGD